MNQIENDHAPATDGLSDSAPARRVKQEASMVLKGLATILFSIALPVTALAGPTTPTASARAGARIVAAPRTISVPSLPSRVELTSSDLARGYAIVPISQNDAPQSLALRSGDRDEGRLGKTSSTDVRVSVASKSEKVEMIMHVE